MDLVSLMGFGPREGWWSYWHISTERRGVVILGKGVVNLSEIYIFEDTNGIYLRPGGAQNPTPLSPVVILSLLSSSLELLGLLMTCTCVVRKIADLPGSIPLSLSVS